MLPSLKMSLKLLELPPQRPQRLTHFLIELRLLMYYWRSIVICVLMQLFHSISTNVAFFLAASTPAAQRLPLPDLGFSLLPPLPSSLFYLSEVFLYLTLGIALLVVFTYGLVLHPTRPTAHTQPYAVYALRRFLLTLVTCQTLRMICFLSTSLPGPAPQCAYIPTSEQLEQPLSDFVQGPAPPEGNPPGWNPPADWIDVLTRLDVSTGCGDLLFSSHLTFALISLLSVSTYTRSRARYFLLCSLLFLIPLTIASRKHYSVDVIVACFTVPLVYSHLLHTFPDKDPSTVDGMNVKFSQELLTVELAGKARQISVHSLPFGLRPTSMSKELEGGASEMVNLDRKRAFSDDIERGMLLALGLEPSLSGD